MAWLKSATLSATIIIEFLKSHYTYILWKNIDIESIINHSQYLPCLPKGKQCACKFALCSSYDGVLLFSFIVLQYRYRHDQHAYIRRYLLCNFTYFDISVLPLLGHITRISWIRIHINIYTYYFCMNIIHLYLFCVLWYSVVSQIFCITYSRTPFLCLVVLLPLGRTKRILYYLLFDILLAILLTFEDIRIQRKQSSENTH